MGTIALKNIRVYAYHGCLGEEHIIGSDYRVDVKVKSDMSRSAQSDALNDTVDYVDLCAAVTNEMKIPSKLLETVAKRIINVIMERCPGVKKVTVAVSKLNPPINADVEAVSVKLSARRKSSS